MRCRGDGSPSVRGGVDGVLPQLGELVVEPEERERDPRHVERGAVLADVGVDDLRPRRAQQLGHAAVYDEQFLVLHRAEAVEDGHHPVPADRVDAVGQFGRVGERPDEQFRERVGGGDVGFVDTGFAVDAEPHRHASLRNVEERGFGAGERAAAERDAEGPRPLVRARGGLGHRVQVVAVLRGGGRGPEHGEVAGDPATAVALGGRGGGDVVGDRDGAHRDALVPQAGLGCVEVEDVAGVVAVAEEHAAAGVGGARGRVDLLGRGRGEEVPHGRRVGETRTDQAAECGVVARAAADDDGDLAGGGCRRPRHATGDAADVPAVGRDEPVDHLVGEDRGVVPESGHR